MGPPDKPGDDEVKGASQRKDLYAGLGVILFEDPQGPGFFKGGHDSQTASIPVCLERPRCLLLMSNDVRAEAAYAELVGAVLGESDAPWDWEYGENAGRS